MLLIVRQNIWQQQVIVMVGPCAYCWVFIYRSLSSENASGQLTHCLTSQIADSEQCVTVRQPKRFTTILSRLSANVGSLKRQHAFSFGKLPAVICNARHWTASSDVECCLVRLVGLCQAGHAYSDDSYNTRALTWSSNFNAMLIVTPSRLYFLNSVNSFSC